MRHTSCAAVVARPRTANANYGANLIFWDIVFGTRYLPKHREPPADIGFHGMNRFPRAHLGQLVSPVNTAWLNEGNPSLESLSAEP